MAEGAALCSLKLKRRNANAFKTEQAQRGVGGNSRNLTPFFQIKELKYGFGKIWWPDVRASVRVVFAVCVEKPNSYSPLRKDNLKKMLSYK